MADPATPETGKAARSKNDREALLAKLTDGNCSLDYPDPLKPGTAVTSSMASASPETENNWHNVLSSAIEKS